MALQDVCGFCRSPWPHRRCSPVSHSVPLEDSSQFFRGSDTGHSTCGAMLRTSRWSPLLFSVPAGEFLTESPMEFGQVHPNATRSAPEPSHRQPPSLPPLAVPAALSPSVPLPFPLSHGTTTLGFMFQGGVIAAADTRSSCSGLVACPASQKILPVHSHLVGTTSGTSADCALWKRILARELRLYQLRHGRRLTTGGAAKLLSHMLHPFKGTELCVAATLCGWDGGQGEHARHADWDKQTCSSFEVMTENNANSQPIERGVTNTQPMVEHVDQGVASDSRERVMKMSGPSLVYVCSDGTRLPGRLFSVGSGSPYALSVLDDRVQWGMSIQEAVSVAREAVYRATHRDAYSGNFVDLYHVTAKGWKRRDREELREEYYREREKERRRVEDRSKRESDRR